MSTLATSFRMAIRRLQEIFQQGGLGGLKRKALWVLLNWLRQVRERSLWLSLRTEGHDGVLTVSVESGTLEVDPLDHGISRELLIYGVHEPIASRLLKEFLQDEMVVIDIGSNIGYYVLIEKLQVGERGIVVAIEPSPRNVDFLKRNIALNALTGVTVVEGAVSNGDGEGVLYTSERSNCHSMLPLTWNQHGTLPVRSYSLDTVVDRLKLTRVDIIRMDIEGYEVVAIEGMLDTLRRYAPMLMIELHPSLVGGQKIVNLLTKLKDLGYETQYVVDRLLDNRWTQRRGKVAEEEFSIDELVTDDRVAYGEHALIAFFVAANV